MKTKNIKSLLSNLNMKVFTIVLILVWTLGSQAQTNLIPNSSFEAATECKPGSGIYKGKVPSWNRPLNHTGKCRYFTPCNPNNTAWNTLQNNWGTQAPNAGTAYAGVETYSVGTNPKRSYLQTSLNTPLIAGRTYQATMYVSLADKSQYATDGIGMYFSTTAIAGSGKLNLNYTPQVASTTILNNKTTWVQITGTFVATGGERYLTIGNFKNDINTLKQNFGSGTGMGSNCSFYYVDNLSVIELTGPLAPVANFATNPNPATGTAPFGVIFTDQSTNTPTSWLWTITPATGYTFLSGSATSQNPIINFTNPGTYSVTLTASNSIGTNTSTPRTITVNAPALPPVAAFATNPNPATGATPLSVTFTDQSTNVPTSWLWTVTPSIGFTYTSGSATSQNPVINFTAPGTYLVTLRATNGAGNNTSAAKTVTVIAPPVAAFATNPNPASGTAPLSVTFTDQSTNTPTSWQWNVTPATGFTYTTGSATSQNPVINFTTVGTYSVTLTATNSAGSNTTTARTITVNGTVIAPVAAYTSNPVLPASGNIPFNVAFTDQSTNAPTSWLWTVSPSTGFTYQTGSATSQNPVIRFTATGLYTVTLSATNSAGSNTTTVNYIVANPPLPPPAAAFTTNPNPATGYAPLSVSCADQSTNTPTSWQWNVTPATGFSYTTGSATSQNPVINFTTAGTYTVTLTATNAQGSTTSSARTVTVNAPTPVVTFYSRANGSWNTLNTWSTSTTGTPAATALPDYNDIVYVRHAVTVGTTQKCAQVDVSASSTYLNASLDIIGGLLDVTGNLTSANSGTSTVYVRANQNGILNVLGNVSVTNTNGSTSIIAGTANQNYDANGTSLLPGTQGNINISGTITSNLTSGALNFNLEAYNSSEILISGSGTSSITQNTTTAGIVTILSSDDSYITFNAAATFNLTHTVGGNVNVMADWYGYITFPNTTFTHSGGGDDWFVRTDKESSFDFTNFTFNNNAPYQDGSDMFLTVGANATYDMVSAWDITGNLIINHNGGTNFDFNLDGISVDGDTDGGALQVNGNFIINHTNGRRFQMEAPQWCEVEVGGYLRLNNASSATGTLYMNFYNDSQLKVAGNVEFMTSTGTRIQMNGFSWIFLGSTVTIPTGANFSSLLSLQNDSRVIYNGTAPQTIVGTTYRELQFSNASGMTLGGNVVVQTKCFLVDGKINLNGYSFTVGSSASSPGSIAPLSLPQLLSWPNLGNSVKCWFYGTGSITRWMDNSRTWTTGQIFTVVDAAQYIIDRDQAGYFPVGTATAHQPIFFAKKLSGSGTGGNLTITTHTSSDVWTAATFNDNDATPVRWVNGSTWALSSTNGLTTGTWDMAVSTRGTTYTAPAGLRITKAASTINGTHANLVAVNENGTSVNYVQRTNVPVADIKTSIRIASVSTTKNFQIEEETTEVKITEENISINNFYPNPVSSEANLNIQTAEDMNVEIQVMDIAGRLVFKGNETLIAGENNFSMDMSDLTAGTYFFRIISEKGTAVKRFMKSK